MVRPRFHTFYYIHLDRSSSPIDIDFRYCTIIRILIIVPLHLIILCIVRTVRYLSSQGDSEAVPYLKSYPSVPGNPHCEFRGSGRSCSRSAAGISACSRPARQCPDRPVTPRSNPGMHAVSENSEFRIPKCPDCIHAKSVRIPVLLILWYRLTKWRGNLFVLPRVPVRAPRRPGRAER